MQGGNLVVVAQPVAQLVLKFNEFPVDMVDSKGNHFTTEVRYVNGLLTWVAVGITCLIAGILCMNVLVVWVTMDKAR